MPDVVDTIGDFWKRLNGYAVNGRGLLYSCGYASIKHQGAGQFYLLTFRDNDRRFLDGSASARLTVAANPPVRLYWSATIYDRATYAFIRDQTTLSRSSLRPGIQKSASGSVEVYFGSKAPPGEKSNWVPIDPGRRQRALMAG